MKGVHVWLGYMSHKRDKLLGIYVYWVYLFMKNYKEAVLRAILRIEIYCTLLKYIDYMIAR